MDILVFLGSVRDSTPPRPARLGARVAAACCRLVAARGHAARLIDPLEIDTGPDTNPDTGPDTGDLKKRGVFKPHFAYPRGAAPGGLERLADAIGAADGYVMVSPEYNHSMSPALAHLLNHFGASLFAWKPSAIVTYSAGQWGGVRAAAGMRSFLSELGCLPVSAMVHVPKAQEVLAGDGSWLADAGRWDGYVGRTLAQLDWWAQAARRQRTEGEGEPTRPFTRDPSQRNAP
ncbi:hypothetical protein GCM10011342_28620 [Aquisalinus flavus]|uniref:NADPH-dependent FMN reductase-like domain-containing protein n=1 Tax=Aquisalinus flavus TaxID=1526572 RepID=A0A8J2V599_9PROT|nr:NAD(P)H-dependent oxidoreductase [Aquisalinus flavus]MBD0428159.1 NAD(P)H-dependent oxidoreductase [Aquisalinus flavus]GGD18206.1 hypothetical protein GCM10011342_28620 [Aquisalinus flavus]